MLLIRLEKVTKPSLKTLDSTNPQSRLEIQDYGYLPEKWLSNKDHSKAERVIVCEDAKVPRVTSKQLKSFSHWLMLMFMSPPSGEHWATMVCMAELQEESHGDESTYRQEVKELAVWCSFNNLELNTLKTVEMIVDFRRNPPALPYSPSWTALWLQ